MYVRLSAQTVATLWVVVTIEQIINGYRNVTVIAGPRPAHFSIIRYVADLPAVPSKLLFPRVRADGRKVCAYPAIS